MIQQLQFIFLFKNYGNIVSCFSLRSFIIALKNKVKETESAIDTVFQNRYDLISNLEEVVKEYAQHEKTILDSKGVELMHSYFNDPKVLEKLEIIEKRRKKRLAAHLVALAILILFFFFNDELFSSHDENGGIFGLYFFATVIIEIWFGGKLRMKKDILLEFVKKLMKILIIKSIVGDLKLF